MHLRHSFTHGLLHCARQLKLILWWRLPRRVLRERIARSGQEARTNRLATKVENYTIPLLQQHTSTYIMGPCSGAGVSRQAPFTQRSTRLKMPLEVKATSDWNPADSNRRVLTSSSTKLRKQFKMQIHHVFLTVLYAPTSTHATIDVIRLDFLEPSTSVSVRLEASVNHKILSREPHHTIVI